MIVHVVGRTTAGGNERLCLEIIRRAPPNVRQAMITIDPSPVGDLEALFRAIPNLEILNVPYAAGARAAFVLGLAAHLRRLAPRGVIAYPFGLHLLVALAAKAVPGCRFVAHVGNPPPAHGARRRLFRSIVVASRWLSVPLWSCSTTVHDQLSALGAMPRNSFAVQNGINIQALNEAAARGRVARTGDGPIITMIARLDAIKDHDTLLAAFARVVVQQPRARLWIVGTGNRRAELESRTAALGLTSAVRFLGVRTDVGEILGQTDVFVFSTTSAEGFGIALAEAMAVGLPVVASDVPACREVLDGGGAGRLVPSKDRSALAGAILELLADRAEGARLGQAATALARARFDVTDCARKYFDYLLSGTLP